MPTLKEYQQEIARQRAHTIMPGSVNYFEKRVRVLECQVTFLSRGVVTLSVGVGLALALAMVLAIALVVEYGIGGCG